ncbi:MAG: GAF domain-containing protein [Zetaproteobacteria bacterium]|nr:MAG: GAF domain-containing protein [Zetaproteobacteria bacterium]
MPASCDQVGPSASDNLLRRIDRLNEIGVLLSAESDHQRLLEKIMNGARELTGADGGTLYQVDDAQRLRFVVVQNDTLEIRMGGDGGDKIPMAPIPLYREDGSPNDNLVAVHAAVHGETINIADAYNAKGFNFSGTRAFDARTGYRSQSFLTVPMTNQRREVIGVLQLINAKDAEGRIVAFSREDQKLAESLASQAAVAITNRQLMDELKQLLESFIDVISGAIDAKSPYTGGHCRRVPEIALMLADAVSEAEDGPFADFRLSAEERYEMKIASMMHDCGKITTPVHIVDKGTKLETIFDRIALVDAKFELARKEAEIRALRKALQQGVDVDEEALSREVERLNEEQEFVRRCNKGGEFMSEEDQERIRRIGERQIPLQGGGTLPLLSDDEVRNLNIAKGTLLPEERQIINDHIVQTIKMLRGLPFPEHLKRVPEIAGGHHEKMDGTGYPMGLTREQMSVQARILGIADIFEALTACDRPYKEGLKLSQVLRIMRAMKEERHIDGDLFDEFVRRKVYLAYARKNLDPKLIDVD